MKILIIDNADKADVQFNAPLLEAMSELAEIETVNYLDIDQAISLPELYDGIIISGVPLYYGYETMHDRAARLGWILTCEQPVLGICLGHQIIGSLFGAEILKGTEAENGTLSMRSVKQDPIFDGLGSTFKARALHRASVTLPEEFELLASSATCYNQIMKHRTRDIYGLQFHPERSATSLQFLRNFTAIVQSRKISPEPETTTEPETLAVTSAQKTKNPGIDRGL